MIKTFNTLLLGITTWLLMTSILISQEQNEQNKGPSFPNGIPVETKPEVVDQFYDQPVKDIQKAFSEMKKLRPFVRRSFLMEISDSRPLQLQLELTPLQVTEIKDISANAKRVYEKTVKKYDSLAKKLKARPDDPKIKKEAEIAQEELKKSVLAETEKLVDKMEDRILVDFQIELLEILVWRQCADQCLPRSINPLAWPLVYGGAIGMSDGELKALKEKVQKTNEKLQKTISEAKERAWKDVVNSLPQGKKEKFKKIFDREFSLEK